MNEATLCKYANDGIALHGDHVVYRWCQLTKTQVDTFNCLQCPNRVVPEPQPESKPVPKLPSIASRMKTWAEAVEEWTLAGCPSRSQEEVDHIYKDFCESCPFRQQDKNVCLVCGCRVDTYSYAIFNKIKMSTQHCPKGKW